MADVWIDGIFVGEVNLNRSSSASQIVAYSTRWSTSGTHTIEIRNLATPGHPRIDIDAFIVTR